MRGEIRQAETKLQGELKRLEERIDGVEAKLTERINGVETKLTEKMDGIGKRLDNQEFISRGAIITLVGGVLTGLVKYLFFSNS